MHKSAIVLGSCFGRGVHRRRLSRHRRSGLEITGSACRLLHEIMTNAAKNLRGEEQCRHHSGNPRRRPTPRVKFRSSQSMIAQGVNGLAIAPVGVGVTPALDKAVAAGIKVVLVDNDIPDWTSKSSFVGTNNFNGGVIAGKYSATRLKDGDEIAVLAGVPGVPALDDRVNGMLKGLSGVKVKVVSTWAPIAPANPALRRPRTF